MVIKRRFVPKRTDDLRADCLPYVGEIVTVSSWHENVAMKEKYPDDERVGYVAEMACDIPESELLDSRSSAEAVESR